MITSIITALWILGYIICSMALTELRFDSYDQSKGSYQLLKTLLQSLFLWPILLIPVLYNLYNRGNNNDNKGTTI